MLITWVKSKYTRKKKCIYWKNTQSFAFENFFVYIFANIFGILNIFIFRNMVRKIFFVHENIRTRKRLKEPKNKNRKKKGFCGTEKWNMTTTVCQCLSEGLFFDLLPVSSLYIYINTSNTYDDFEYIKNLNKKQWGRAHIST